MVYEKKPTLIGVAGQMGSGKDFVADYLIRNKYANEKLSFARAVKECAEWLFDVPLSDRSLRARLYRQGIGNGMRDLQESIDGKKSVWIDTAFKKANDPEKTYVISDVRYQNEAKSIITSGGILIYLYSTPETRKKRIEQRDKIKISDKKWLEIKGHESEKDVGPSAFSQFLVDNNINGNYKIIYNEFEYPGELFDEIDKIVNEIKVNVRQS